LLKRTVDPARVVAEVKAELDRVRAEGEVARAEAHELARAWLHAATQTEAEESIAAGSSCCVTANAPPCRYQTSRRS
jgi:hypothetical protein